MIKLDNNGENMVESLVGVDCYDGKHAGKVVLNKDL